MNRKSGSVTEITMKSVVLNAISKGVTSEHVADADRIEKIELSKQETKKLEGEIRDD